MHFYDWNQWRMILFKYIRISRVVRLFSRKHWNVLFDIPFDFVRNSVKPAFHWLECLSQISYTFNLGQTLFFWLASGFVGCGPGSFWLITCNILRQTSSSLEGTGLSLEISWFTSCKASPPTSSLSYWSKIEISDSQSISGIIM